MHTDETLPLLRCTSVHSTLFRLERRHDKKGTRRHDPEWRCRGARLNPSVPLSTGSSGGGNLVQLNLHTLL